MGQQPVSTTRTCPSFFSKKTCQYLIPHSQCFHSVFTTTVPFQPGWPTLCFYNVSTGQEAVDGAAASFYNTEEARLVVALIEGLVLEGVQPQDIGVITLYKAQLACITQRLNQSR